ncbi:AraC family transcriptional regulator [Candidatus Allofournierella excrementavium]|uniref:AraC family transcriptional regulator n=1 Tax=Candidatus Allofournierella excrementavium TaxID=2838591 RepID=UPI00374E221E
MPRIPLYYQDDEFFEEFGTSCYINHEKMVDVFPLYRHDFMEISLIVEGSGTELCNGRTYPVQEGCVSVSAPWHFHTLNTRSDQPVTRFICEFSLQDYLHYASVWPDARSALFDRHVEPVVQLSEQDYQRSCSIFNDMYEIFTQKGEDRQVRLYLKLVEFMMLFHRAQKQGGVQPGRPDAPRDQLVQDALRCIHKLYSQELTLADVAREVGASPATLREQLLAYTGQDFQALVTEIRIRNACVLLGLKTPTLKYIAHNTGFGSVQTFYRAFQNYKGMTPEEYRKRHWMESEGKAG